MSNFETVKAEVTQEKQEKENLQTFISTKSKELQNLIEKSYLFQNLLVDYRKLETEMKRVKKEKRKVSKENKFLTQLLKQALSKIEEISNNRHINF